MTYTRNMHIAGELVAGAGHIEATNPATEESIGTVAAAGLAEVERALQAARAAFPMWSRTTIADWQAWMMKFRDCVIASEEHLRGCIHYEMGKSWGGTKEEEDFDSLNNSPQFYAEEIARVWDESLPDRAGTRDHRLAHEPVGVVVAFIAWNFPLLNSAFKIGPAMAAGCPIIIRPSAAAPVSAYAVGELCAQIGLPKGVVQIPCIDGYEAADALSASEIPALLTLIGSTATGRHTYAHRRYHNQTLLNGTWRQRAGFGFRGC